MHKNSLIQVEVTEYDDERTYGTAYLINEACAITALHVVENYKAIQFNFSNGVVIKSEGEFDIPYKSKTSDIAVVRFTSEDNSQLPPCESIRVDYRPLVDDRWYGEGYPKFVERHGSRLAEKLKGDCYRLVEGENQLELTCDKQAKIAKWGGISGAPVFLSKNGCLTAIITKYDQAINNTHFKAAPLSACLRDLSFSRFFTNQARSERLKENTLSLLAKHPEVLDAFRKPSANEIIDSLRPGGIEKFFEQAETLTRSVSPSLASEIILQCLPHFFVNQSVIIDQSILGKDLIDLDCVTQVSAECSMAAFAGRAANLSCSGGLNSQPYITNGSYALGPSTGIDNPELDLQNLTSQLLVSSSLDINIQSRLANFAVGKSNVVEYVNRKLDRDRGKGKYYYYIVSLTEASPDSVALMGKIQIYKKNYPLLIFINLKQRDDIPFEEGALYEFLPELITS